MEAVLSYFSVSMLLLGELSTKNLTKDYCTVTGLVLIGNKAVTLTFTQVPPRGWVIPRCVTTP